MNVDQEKAFDRVSHQYLSAVIRKYGFGENFQKWIKILNNNIYAKVLINGELSSKIDIRRSVRQGCPLAPFLYVCVIETLLIKIRADKNIIGIPSPSNYDRFLDVSFADDTNFLVTKIICLGIILSTFQKFGRASGSKTNSEKTEGMWLGSYVGRADEPFGINWVKTSKSLGIIYGSNNTNSLNWIPCFNKFKQSICYNLNRQVSLFGKATILNYIGYAKLWHKASALELPGNLCYDKDGLPVNIVEGINKYTLGFLWGFKEENSNNSRMARIPKRSLLKIDTLFLQRSEGGVGLIDYQTKMKAFRILLVFKFLNQVDKHWKGILRYWYSASLHQVSGERWNNNFPHISNIDEIPPYFRQCIIDFRHYYALHRSDYNANINSKIIYLNLMKDKNYHPITLSRFPGLNVKPYFQSLHNRKNLDPELKDFLFKLYHGRLYFKKYTTSLNDLLPSNRYNCIICNSSHDTPRHLFMNCRRGQLLREKRNEIIDKFANSSQLSDENKIGCFFSENNIRVNTIALILILSNYTIYKFKMKKFYNPEEVISSIGIMQSFKSALKNRMICDLKLYKREYFIQHWDPGGEHMICDYVDEKITSWYF